MKLKRGRTHLRWECICKCGTTVVVVGTELNAGRVKSCGCWSTERATSHGQSRTRLYKIWNSMLQRCHNFNNNHYEYYGGRGIFVCKEWFDFNNFYNDLKDGYKKDLTLDRVNNSLGYFKENCKWSTMKEQIMNRRNSIFIETPWGLLSIEDAAEKSGLKVIALRTRIFRNWPKEKWFKPAQKRTYSNNVKLPLNHSG